MVKVLLCRCCMMNATSFAAQMLSLALVLFCCTRNVQSFTWCPFPTCFSTVVHPSIIHHGRLEVVRPSIAYQKYAITKSPSNDLGLSSHPSSRNVEEKDTNGQGAIKGRVVGLYRHAVKGLSADSLESVYIANSGETFPDDRRFALLKSSKKDDNDNSVFQSDNPQWLHKENFLCAFTAPKLMAKYRASYGFQLQIDDTGNDDDFSKQYSFASPCDQVITARTRINIDGKHGESDADDRCLTSLTQSLILHERDTDDVVLGPIDLSTVSGRSKLAVFFTEKSSNDKVVKEGESLVCVCGSDKANRNNDKNSKTTSESQTVQIQHTHQFGNTSSGWKQRGDTRTVHIVNAATVRQLSERISPKLNLNPKRFRPNIVIDDNNSKDVTSSSSSSLQPWIEFDWIGKRIQIGNTVLSVLSKTVRCDGVSIDPEEDGDDRTPLDIPGLLVKHFPEHGPYLGVYAVIETDGGCTISLGDTIKVLD